MTYQRFSQTYGFFEVRAKFPNVTVPGLQSTLWLWPVNKVNRVTRKRAAQAARIGLGPHRINGDQNSRETSLNSANVINRARIAMPMRWPTSNARSDMGAPLMNSAK